MKMNTMQLIKWLVLLLVASAPLTGFASGDTLVSFRVYEGRRGVEKTTGTVVATYDLKPLFVGNIFPSTCVAKEKDELKRIFNLGGIRVVARSQWGWKTGEAGTLFKGIVLNGYEFRLSLELLKKADSFNLKVVESAKTGERSLLETELVLPQRKTAVFGFEDSAGKPYFISFRRETDESVIPDDAVAEPMQPTLIHRVIPELPTLVSKHPVQGNVIINAIIGPKGNVIHTRFLKGHPLLRQPSLAAVKKWKYSPFIVNGKPEPAAITIVFNYTVSGDITVKEKQDGHATMLKNIPSIWPTKGYLTSPMGWRKHPVTGKRSYHKGQDIATKAGSDVLAAGGGEVVFAGRKGDLGNIVVIDHKNGYVSHYAQLKSYTVKKGDKVNRGHVIGYVGMSGNATGPHLHYEVHLDGEPVNPLNMIFD